jgi:dihydropteroate synthase
MTEYRAKDTFFSKNRSLNCNGKLLNLSTPRIMGILNITSDSFYDGGKYTNVDDALNRVRQMIEEGADIIDIGAASSRPGAELSKVDEEIDRLSPVLEQIRNEFPNIIISVDTYHAKVARGLIEKFSVDIINDISAGEIDPDMCNTVTSLGVPYIIMHMQGVPGNMQKNPEYQNITDEIVQYFSEKIHKLRKKGVADVLIDPGFGFGKTHEHNYELLSHTEAFQMFELPIVAGVSRKSMIYKLLDSTSEESLNGTTAVHMLLLQKGVQILRVHDVKEAREVVKIYLESLKKA